MHSVGVDMEEGRYVRSREPECTLGITAAKPMRDVEQAHHMPAQSLPPRQGNGCILAVVSITRQ